MKFALDPKKANANFRKHGISFHEATTAFRDPLSTTGRDPDHSNEEERFITFGLSSRRRLLVVGFAERDDTIRIITARLATKKERSIYEEG